MNRITLHEEYRLIERSESEVNGAWKGAHLLLFFLAFVFGSFCTVCFHMLMFLFDEKCVLFPKLLSLSSMRHNILNDFWADEEKMEVSSKSVEPFFLAFVFGSFCTVCFHMLMFLFDEKCVLFPKLLSLSSMRHNILNDFWADEEKMEGRNMDFVSAQWVEQSACYLPTYVPLVSGIFGLVWTTMFLMCSSGSRTLTGLQQPWRILPPVFVFSVAMGILCTYTSIITYNGLQELCLKLAEVTGTKTCSYAVNVATLAYERRIRGVYQATRLTIFTAWIHTACWLLAALLALIRILLVVDFRLVSVRAELVGDVDKMLERHEEHLRTVSPDLKIKDDYTNTRLDAHDNIQGIDFKNAAFRETVSQTGLVPPQVNEKTDDTESLHYVAFQPRTHSRMALVHDEQLKLASIEAKKKRFVIQILDDLLDGMPLPSEASSTLSIISVHGVKNEPNILKQLEQRRITSGLRAESGINDQEPTIEQTEAEERAKAFRREMQEKLSALKPEQFLRYQSNLNLTPELEQAILRRSREDGDDDIIYKTKLKSNLKTKGNQTETYFTRTKGTQQTVQIADSKTSLYSTVSEETLKPYSSEEYETVKEQITRDELETNEGRETVQEGEDVLSSKSLESIKSLHDEQTQSHNTQEKETQTPEKEKQD